MDLYLALKWVHVVSATVLFGTGLGTAFHMWMAHRSGVVAAIAVAARNTVRADAWFTLPAIVVQPVSGGLLVWIGGYDPLAEWLMAVYGLFVVVGACWLPVVAIQARAARAAADAAREGTELPPAYHRLMRTWFWLGWPAFIAMLAILWLMVTRPVL